MTRSMTFSPTFVATFSDGEITQMTTHCADGKLDLGRGVRLSRAAYESRKKKPPPPMIAGHFEMPPNSNGGAAVILQTYAPDDFEQQLKNNERS
jgi:hypothetical protein